MTATYTVDNPEVLKTLTPGDRVTARVVEGNFKVLYDVRVRSSIAARASLPSAASLSCTD
jgi:hypothetical protein